MEDASGNTEAGTVHAARRRRPRLTGSTRDHLLDGRRAEPVDASRALPGRPRSDRGIRGTPVEGLGSNMLQDALLARQS